MPDFQKQFPHYLKLIRFDKPIGTYLLMWPTLWALWIASDGFPGWHLLVVFVLGVFLMRSAGCAINDYADRDIDAFVDRTQQRPLATGAITTKEALGVFVALCLLSFLLVLQLNWLTVFMSIFGLILAATYPYMKRFHSLPQVHLGVAFGWAIPMVFTAVTNDWPGAIAWLIFSCGVIYSVIYDTQYAMADREEDLKLGMKSSAILFGRHDKLIVGILQCVLVLLLLWLGQLAGLSGIFHLFLAAATTFFVYQQFLIKDREPALCFQGFLNNNWFGMTVFIGIALDLYLH